MLRRMGSENRLAILCNIFSLILIIISGLCFLGYYGNPTNPYLALFQYSLSTSIVISTALGIISIILTSIGISRSKFDIIIGILNIIYSLTKIIFYTIVFIIILCL